MSIQKRVTDAGAVKGHLSGDLKQVMAINEASFQAAAKSLHRPTSSKLDELAKKIKEAHK